MNRAILLVDDDAGVLGLLDRFFEGRGWQVQCATEAAGALAFYEQERPDVVLLDINLPGTSGMHLLEVLSGRDPDATVIMMTGDADVSTAVEAMRLGAENFLTKPFDLAHLEAATERALDKAQLRRRNRFLAERRSDDARTDALGSSPVMRDIARQVERLAASGGTVLITGETGTGKLWVARMLHALSDRAAGPFVEIGCAGLSADALEAELLGHEKSTGPDARPLRRGLFEAAQGGTLFLDEVGEMPPELQPVLLHVLESGRFRRVGGTRDIVVAARLIAATSRELEAADGQHFREDLLYRLNALPLRLPPLRERGRQEIADLAVRLLLELRRTARHGPDRFSDEAIGLIAAYDWPGNIRQLRNVIERVLLLSADSAEVEPAHLPPEIAGTAEWRDSVADAELSLDEVERRHIARVLAHHGGNRSSAARSLGISRATLYEKIARYGLGPVGRAGRRP